MLVKINDYYYTLEEFEKQNIILLVHSKGKLATPYVDDKRISLEMLLDNNMLKDLNKKYLKRGKRKKRFDEKDVKEMELMRSQGMSNVKIAKHFNCCEKTIRNYLNGRSE